MKQYNTWKYLHALTDDVKGCTEKEDWDLFRCHLVRAILQLSWDLIEINKTLKEKSE